MPDDAPQPDQRWPRAKLIDVTNSPEEKALVITGQSAPQEPLPIWNGPGPKHGLPFKLFPRDWTAEQIHAWMVEQGWVKDRQGEPIGDGPAEDEIGAD